MDVVEDLDNKIMRTLFLKDEEEKKAARLALAEGPMPVALKGLARCLEKAGGEYFAGGRLTVADLKVFVWVRYLRGGVIDYLPTDLPDKHAPTLVAHFERVMALPVISKHYE
jgi:glutathione S-transferase